MTVLELVIHRKILNENSTEGNFYIQQKDGSWKWFCHVVEDRVRAKPGEWKKELKVYGKTAIPYGRYRVLATWSNRFKRILTGIFGVPDFEGIRIHNGKTDQSSAGCPIISYHEDISTKRTDDVVNDRSAMNDLCKLVEETQKTGNIYITITDTAPIN